MLTLVVSLLLALAAATVLSSTAQPPSLRPGVPLLPMPAAPAAALGGLAAVAALAGTAAAGTAAARPAAGRGRKKEDEHPGTSGSAGEASTAGSAGEGSMVEVAADAYRRWEASLGPDVEVVMLDPGGDGRIALRVGPADAEHVALFVPGTGADLVSAVDVGLDQARTIRLAAQLADPTASVAVIYALPFDSPDHVVSPPLSADCACNPALAEVGAAELARFVQDLDLGSADVTVIGYSYGSTVVGKALVHEGLAASVDRVALIASPGAGADRAEQLQLDEAQVFAMTSDGDIIDRAPSLRPMAIGALFAGPMGFMSGAWWALGDAVLRGRLTHGTDPTNPRFGATVVETGHFGHGEYFDDVDHLAGIGRIVVGRRP